MIKAITVRPGDRVGVRNGQGRVITRTVVSVGADYVTIQWNESMHKIPECKITSHVKADESRGRRYSA